MLYDSLIEIIEFNRVLVKKEFFLKKPVIIQLMVGSPDIFIWLKMGFSTMNLITLGL